MQRSRSLPRWWRAAAPAISMIPKERIRTKVEGAGHEGDAPKLNATAEGINETVEAPRLRLSDVEGRALMIHEGGDNYSDSPENGGGKGRIACGVVPKS